VPKLSTFEGSGVSYWVSAVEARLCAGQEVALVGGGNSAGQAVVFLAPQVKRLHLVVRRDLPQTMSRYLIDRIAALPNVEIHIGSEIAGLEGKGASGLSTVIFRNRRDGTLHWRAVRHLFLLIGADPNPEWARLRGNRLQGLHHYRPWGASAWDKRTRRVRHRRCPCRLHMA
jgi:thioredoxin reductase (NADPH)